MTTRAAKKTPRYYFVAADVPPERAEDFGVRFFDVGAQGVEVRDETTLVRGKTGRVTVVGSFPTEELAKQALAQLPKSVGGRIEELVGDEWRDAWKEHFRPFRLCPGLWIRPPWEKLSPPTAITCWSWSPAAPSAPACTRRPRWWRASWPRSRPT